MIKILINIITAITILVYRSVRLRLGKITEENFSRYLIFNLIFGLFSTLMLAWEEEGLSMILVSFIYMETIFYTLKFLVITLINKTQEIYYVLSTKAIRSIRIKKDGGGYKLTLSWWPLKIFLFFKNIYFSLLILVYKTMDYLHDYLPFIPGNHDKIAGISKRTVNQIMAKIKLSAKKEKIKCEIVKVYFDDDFIDFQLLIETKKSKNWLTKFTSTFQKTAKLDNCYIRKATTKPLTVSIIISKTSL